MWSMGAILRHQEASADADGELVATHGEEEPHIPVATQEDGSITSTAVLRYLGSLQHPVGVDIALPIPQHLHDELLILFARETIEAALLKNY